MDTVDVEEEEEHHQEDVEGVEVGLLVYVQHFDDTLEYAQHDGCTMIIQMLTIIGAKGIFFVYLKCKSIPEQDATYTTSDTGLDLDRLFGSSNNER